ncbi:MAG: sugar ABC transporter substrate-binding protein [Chloroflexales bacterium]|nr:sugar ABC transporter substrate-binding protein [Chloroflexales bacterium]
MSRSPKRHTRRSFLRGVLTGSSAMILAACDDQTASPAIDSPAPTTATALAPDSAAPAQISGAGQTLSFMIIQPHALTGDILKQEFEQATGATVNVTAVPYDQVQAKATLDVQSGAYAFDVFDYWYTTVGALATQGIIEDLTDFIEQNPDIEPSDFIPSIYDTYTLVDGRCYGLPIDGDTHVLFYNTEIFERNGLQPPTTWEEYETAVQTITEAESGSGIYGAALMGNKAPIIIGSTYSNRLAGFGGAFLENGQPAINSEAAKAAAQSMLDGATYALPTPLETAFDQALPAFLSGKVAMMEFWTDLGVYSQDPQQSQIIDKWDVVSMPVGDSSKKNISPLNAGFGFAVSTGSKNKELAREFVKFAASKTMSLKLLLTAGSGIDPTRRSALESAEYQQFAPKVQKAAMAALNGAFAWPTIPQSPDLMTVLADNLALVLQQSVEPAAAMDTVAVEWKKILGA